MKDLDMIELCYELQAENERLRAALEAMYKQNKYNDCNCAKCRDALALAEQALEATE